MIIFTFRHSFIFVKFVISFSYFVLVHIPTTKKVVPSDQETNECSKQEANQNDSEYEEPVPGYQPLKIKSPGDSVYQSLDKTSRLTAEHKYVQPISCTDV